MAELATLARPYAEAFYEVARKADPAQARAELVAVAQVASNPQLRRYADAPSAGAAQVFDVITSVVGRPLSEPTRNLLRTVIDNGRLAVLPEIALQFHALVNADAGVCDAVIHSAFPIAPGQLAEVVAALERRFGRKLDATVEVQPDLIGGIRVVVGDEVLDTSVKARLAHMKAVLTA